MSLEQRVAFAVLVAVLVALIVVVDRSDEPTSSDIADDPVIQEFMRTCPAGRLTEAQCWEIVYDVKRDGF